MRAPLWESRQQRSEAYRNVFAGLEGSKVLEDLKRTLGYAYRPTFDPNPHIAAFNEGQRSVVLAIANTIEQADLPADTTEETSPDA